MEGSKLIEEQTRFIFETNSIGLSNEVINIDDLIEANNHFKCLDYLIDNAKKTLSESLIKKLHFILKVGTSDSRKEWFNLGGYKKVENEINSKETTNPKDVSNEMKLLIKKYNSKQKKFLKI